MLRVLSPGSENCCSTTRSWTAPGVYRAELEHSSGDPPCKSTACGDAVTL